MLLRLALAAAVSFAAPAALAQTAPQAPAPGKPTPPSTAPASPTPPSAAGASAWDETIRRASQDARVNETDEERERRLERIERDKPPPPATRRVGMRVEVGSHFNDSSSQGDMNFIAGAGAQGVLPLGESFELVGHADVFFGGGKFFTWGPSLGIGARWVADRTWFLGLEAHAAGLQVESYESELLYCNPSSSPSYLCGSGGSRLSEIRLFGHGGLTGGAFLDANRTIELGVNARIGAAFTDGEVSFMSTAHLAYLFSL